MVIEIQIIQEQIMKLKCILFFLLLFLINISYSQNAHESSILDSQISEFVFKMASDPNIHLNEIPMYGGDAITEQQETANNNLIMEIKNLNVTREEAAEQAIMRGWEFFRSGDILASIKRFNQAWLMEPNHWEVFWGFGDYLGIIDEFEGAILMFKKSLELKPGNVYVMADLAKSFNMNGFKNTYYGRAELLEINLIRAIDVIEEAVKIEETGVLYHHWAVSLFYLERYEEAYEKINRAIELGEEVPKEFIDAIVSNLN